MDEFSLNGETTLRDVLKTYVEEVAGPRETKRHHFDLYPVK